MYNLVIRIRFWIFWMPCSLTVCALILLAIKTFSNIIFLGLRSEIWDMAVCNLWPYGPPGTQYQQCGSHPSVLSWALGSDFLPLYPHRSDHQEANPDPKYPTCSRNLQSCDREFWDQNTLKAFHNYAIYTYITLLTPNRWKQKCIYIYIINNNLTFLKICNSAEVMIDANCMIFYLHTLCHARSCTCQTFWCPSPYIVASSDGNEAQRCAADMGCQGTPPCTQRLGCP